MISKSQTEPILIEPQLRRPGDRLVRRKVEQNHRPKEVFRGDLSPIQDIRPACLHSVAEAADLLSICRSTLYGLIRRGKIRSARVGRRRLVSDKAISDFIQANEQKLDQEVR
jgi:excisionase family DNA binding protein